MYSSPHLVHMRERYRINGKSISEELLLEHIYTCYRKLQATIDRRGQHPAMPSYFRFLTLVSYHMFASITPKIDVVILETGMGGRLDATNVFEHPVVCGVTLIDYDHMEVLGDTLEKIAREKAGIFKPNVPVFTIPQHPEAQKTLIEEAQEAKVVLKCVEPLPENIQLGIAGEHQRVNAALAVHLAGTWLSKTTGDGSAFEMPSNASDFDAWPEHFLEALRTTRWDGRCQTLPSTQEAPHLRLYVDGAHTMGSMLGCLQWFGQTVGIDVSWLTSDLHHVGIVADADTPSVSAITAAVADVPAISIGAAQHTTSENAESKSDCATTEASKVTSVAPLCGLLFNCAHDRNPFDLLRPLSRLSEFSIFVTCPFDFDRPRLRGPPTLEELAKKHTEQLPDCDEPFIPSDCKLADTWQRTLVGVWRALRVSAGHALPAIIEDVDVLGTDVFPFPSHAGVDYVVYAPTVARAIGLLSRLSQQAASSHGDLSILVTGSLYLAGNTLAARNVQP
jgi:folylpolyglutamate synthase/dihydropteroate synthase